MKAVVQSQQGSHSDSNEDACFAMPNLGLFAVADGVGGGPAGELASRTVIETLQGLLGTVVLSVSEIERAIQQANINVLGLANTRGLKGMASTLVLAWCAPSTVTCFSVGDSRIYRFRDGELRQLTTDHVKSVTRKDRAPKLMVTRALGVKDEMDVDINEWDHLSGDVLILMSDGISDPLQDNELGAILAESRLSMMDKASAMIRASESKGCTDDKTIVLAFG